MTAELECLVQRYLQNLVLKEETAEAGVVKKQYTGYIDTEKMYNSFIADLKALGYLFSTENSNFNKSGRIVFSFEQKNADIPIPYFGFPFQVVKSIYKACSQGGNCETKKPSKFLMLNYSLTKKPRTRNKPSKKTGCPAFMTVKCVRVFDDERYRANGYKKGSNENSKILERLNKDLQAPTPPAGTLRFIVLMSSAEQHNHGVAAANLNHRLDPRLKEEIYAFAKTNPCSVEGVRSHLREVVREMFRNGDRPRPHDHNRCYHPTDKVIRFHMNQALSNGQNECDQEALGGYVDRWTTERPDDRLFYRPYKISDGLERRSGPASSTLLFCHQSRWQRHLLRRYGNDVSLLDAAYKTCKYNFPLYFLVVKTNCNDAVVGTFIVQRETTILIEEALLQFKGWNPDWDPEYFLTDNSEANITALAQSFPQTIVYVYSFYREQAWDRWLNKKGSVRKRAVVPILTLWQAVSASQTEEDYVRNVQTMYDDEVYRESVHAQQYFSVEWLPIHQTWVEAYHTDQYVFRITVNNGVDSLHATLRHDFLARNDERTLSGVVRLVVEHVLPDVMERYSCGNIPVEYREFNDAVPEFLKNHPVPFIENVMPRFVEAQAYDATQITEMGDGLLIVRNEPDADEWCSVDFQEAVCSCTDFGKWRIPCKHMCAVFLFTEWGFGNLAASYREHPYVTPDGEFLAETPLTAETPLAADVDPRTPEDPTVMDVEPEVVRETAMDRRQELGEEIDVDRLMEKTREKLKMLHGYTYLQYERVAALKFADAVASLEEEMLSAARKSVKGLSLRPTDCIVPVKTKKYLPLKCSKIKYFALPRCSKGMLPVKSS